MGSLGAIAAFVAAVACAAIALAVTWSQDWWGLLALALAFLLVLALFLLLGRVVAGTWKGIFLNKITNTWSLGATQAVLWSALVLAGLLVLWVVRLRGGHPQPLGMALDTDLLTVLGLPTVAATGGVAVTAGKGVAKKAKNQGLHEVEFARSYLDDYARDFQRARQVEVSDDARGLVERTLELDGDDANAPDSVATDGDGTTLKTAVAALSKGAPASAEAKEFADFVGAKVARSRRGVLAINLDPREASPRDLLTGDEWGDASRTDFGKVQFLIVSLLALAAYAGTLAGQIAGLRNACGPGCEASLPPLSGAFAVLLLSSLTGYLGLKAATNTN